MLLLGIALFFVVLATFWPVVHHGFINYDDPDYVMQNSHVQQGLTWENIGWAFRSTSEAGNWHPMTWISHLMDFQLFGAKAAGHHVTSLLLHAASVVLLFLVLNRMTRARWRSLMVAALFGLHPLRVESVAWVAERKDVLSVFFFMLTLWAYGCYAENPKSKMFYGLALLFFALGLMSKPMLVTLPFVLLLLDYWPLRRVGSESNALSRLLLEKLPFFILSLALCVITMTVQKAGGAINTDQPMTAHAPNVLVAYARYLGKLFWPVNLSAHYPNPGQWPLGTVLAASVLLAGITVLVLLMRRSRPYLSAGWFWYLGMLVPVIGLVQIGALSIADRYTYLPGIGVMIMVVWNAQEWTKSWRSQRIVLGTAAGVILLGCAGLSRRQVGYWENSGTLFQHALEVTGDNELSCSKLADYFRQQGRMADAMALYRRAKQMNPHMEEPQLNLGVILHMTGRNEEAIRQLEEAVRVLPASALIHGNLGFCLFSQGRTDEAAEQLKTALELKPDYPEAETIFGDICLKKGRRDEAVAHYRKALQLRPNFAPAEKRLQAAGE